MDVVEATDTLGLALKLRVELGETLFPVTGVGFELPPAFFIVAQVQSDLPGFAPVPLDLFPDPAPLPLQGFLQELCLTLAALPE